MTLEDGVLLGVTVVWALLALLLTVELGTMVVRTFSRWRRFRRHLQERPASNRRAVWKHVR